MENDKPLIAPEQSLPEITIKVIIIAILLAIILAASNTYLALKIGILTSASIPAAVLSMGILRLFKRSNILENNLIQTAASAGEAVAGGIVYTIPALIIIHYWDHFRYWENFFIALCGGMLGILFSIPLRRVLMTAKHLKFPEGRAIAEVLHMGMKQQFGFKEMLWGGSVGALLELAQTGLKIMANSFQAWFSVGSTVLGFGGGFSATLIGAGYLMSFNVALSLLIGAVLAWGIGLPIFSTLMNSTAHSISPTQTIIAAYSGDMHFIGVGAMLVAGLWTLLGLFKPFAESLKLSFQAALDKNNRYKLLRTERDIPINYVLKGIIVTFVITYFVFQHSFDFSVFNVPNLWQPPLILLALLYVLVAGFLMVVICAYFSGLVGVTASPGSAVVIAGMLLAALIIRSLLAFHPSPLTETILLHAAAITIIVGGVITGAACIANDNIQDLKVGHLIGATPWKQQLMLMLGAIIAAAVIPPIMNMLFNAYGIGGVFPHAGMDASQTLAAPPAAAMAGITQGVFNHDIPWPMVGIGAGVVVLCILANRLFSKHGHELSILALAIGIYLPLTSSVPLFIGGLFALITKMALCKKEGASLDKTLANQKLQRGLLLACGLVAGAALMDVLLAIPMSLAHNPDVLAIMPAGWSGLATLLGALSVLGLGLWFYRVVTKPY